MSFRSRSNHHWGAEVSGESMTEALGESGAEVTVILHPVRESGKKWGKRRKLVG